MPERTWPPALRSAPFAVAILTAVGLVLSAPFVGQIRGVVRSAFPGQYLMILAVVAGLGFTTALALAALRIRERRWVRYGSIALAIIIAVSYSVGTASEFPERNAVERFHFLQYGLVTFLFYRAWRPLQDGGVLILPVLAGLIVSAAEEWLQWFIPNRVGEINDVLLNLVAIVCGLLFSLGVDPPPRLRLSLEPGTRGRLSRLAIVALVAVAAFFHVVHLGHTVEDPEIGTFTTRYSPDRLAALQRERTTTWSMSPPSTRLVRLSREDQYLSEGMEHIRERNELWEAGDVRGSWLENRILEKYYAPVLDTPTHEGSGHRWPTAQRQDASERASTAGAGRHFASTAYPYRLYSWSKAAFWTGVVLFGLFLAWSGRATGAPSIHHS